MPTTGSRPAPSHVLAHLSDPHLLADGTRLHDRIDTEQLLRSALGKVEQSAESLDAIIISGDLTNTADPMAYRLLRDLVTPLADRLGAALVTTGGNHDERRPLARELHGLDTDDPADTVTMVRGLRILAMDSAPPGRHDGSFSEDQFRWLARQLADPAPDGTVLVMHHPPITYRSPWMQLLDFDAVPRLADILRGTDVRAVLSGHLHVPTFGLLPGTAIPVFVAGGVSYADDAGTPRERLMSVDGPQSWQLVEVHEDHVVATVAPALQHDTWPALSEQVADYMAAVPPERKRQVFATKPS